MSDEAVQNTDREIWRGKSRAEFGDDDNYYADSLFVPQSDVEALGINCGGFVIVKPIREWHALAAAQQKGEKMPTFEGQAFEQWYNNYFRFRHVDTKHCNDCEEAWNAALQSVPSSPPRPEGCICSEAYGVGPEQCGKHAPPPPRTCQEEQD